MKFYISALASARRKRNGAGQFGIMKMARFGIYVFGSAIMILVLSLYVSLCLSPGVRQCILENVMQCRKCNECVPLSSAPNHALKNSSMFSAKHQQTGLIEPGSPGTDNQAEFLSSCSKVLNKTIVLSHSCAACNAVSKKHNATFLANSTLTPSAKVRVLIGIVTTASKADRRHILRLAYGVQQLSPSADTEFTVRFVLGALYNDKDRILVGMENATYGDIIILACKENINAGKTFTYFSTLPTMGFVYDYVMKTDDDSYVRLQNLGKHLNPLPKEDLYYGYNLPCTSDNAYSSFLAGAGYLISWDLVLWIKDSPIPRNHSVGIEDKLVGDWFNEGSKAKNRATNKGLFYDHPDFGGHCAHELTMDTVLVHQVKTPARWHQVLNFFEKDRISFALRNAGKIVNTS